MVSIYLFTVPSVDGLPRRTLPPEPNAETSQAPQQAPTLVEPPTTSSGKEKTQEVAPQQAPTCRGLYAVHWTHVPKAGGTAFAAIAKRLACRRNERLFGGDVFNPCCAKDLCLKDGRCDTTFAGGCPLVLGVGMHTFNGARLFDVGCEGCGPRWFELATSRGLLKHVLSLPQEDSTRKKKVVNATREVESLVRWPLEQRVEFFARLGVAPDVLQKHLATFLGRKETNRLADRAAKTYCRQPAMRRETPAYRDETTFATCDGAHSMTVLRHPFPRAASAYFYRGHSPNYDVFELRPGLWLAPNIKYTGTTLHEYLFLPEYRNVLTKMFGDSTECADAKTRGCNPNNVERPAEPRERFVCRCAVYGGCHAYRNSSLSMRHARTALRLLFRHNFVGLQEAPVSSALLAARAFDLDESDVVLEPTRRSKNLGMRCSPSLVMRLDASACRAAFEASDLDVYVFEQTHRHFCRRLHDANLTGDPRVRRELDDQRLCGALDFSDADQVFLVPP
ncbi:hypothetical protein CTAYLR_007091 [Chrysophaeum taylorii]|uniref:Uncharacterized protein n=1 Tax=Chrysophaeum taylorii TaxID=2483200 RepID=A0AAD7UKX2_9STRA|nr:hypothetical protein CTAYLR_007091 [Chrysophaeum taylorii]